jgi:hypothetical protein
VVMRHDVAYGFHMHSIGSHYEIPADREMPVLDGGV